LITIFSWIDYFQRLNKLIIEIPLIGAQIKNMKPNTGIITSKIVKSKDFYNKYLALVVSFENGFYLLMNAADKKFEIIFLLPIHESHQPIFQQTYSGKGMYLTIEVDDADKIL